MNSNLLQEGNIQATNTCPVYFGSLRTTVPVFNIFVKQVGLLTLLKHSAVNSAKPIHRVISYRHCQFLSHCSEAATKTGDQGLRE